ncbi:cell wall hydrolase [Sphingomonas sp. ASV193]|uniref:cell wall hydrolase n=1 Tax=Sphingomonas sp. ASV193 TaxID=3144405 RepID=UPI0032E8A523
MTALRASFVIHRLWWALLAVLLALGAGLSAFGLRGNAAEATVTTLAPAKAAALIEATTGPAAQQMAAVGDKAKLINASLPFAVGAIAPSRPFALASDDGLDHRRALLCMTQAIYYEAGFEPLQGRRAVAQVVLNRMRHPAFPKSVCGVVYQGSTGAVCQFSFVCDGSLYRRPAAAAWKAAQDVAEAALAGYVEKSVGLATHYHADYVAPRWAPMLAKVAVVGQHIFYRWPGLWGQSAAFSGRYIGEPQDPSALRPPLRAAMLHAPDGKLPAGTAGPITDGTVLHRAPSDVGGLLDTSKGWTLNIPLPSDTETAASAVASRQKAAPDPVSPATPIAAIPTGTQVAAR